MRLPLNQPICVHSGVWLRLLGGSACDYVVRYYDGGWNVLAEDQGTLQPNVKDKVNNLYDKTLRFEDIPEYTKRIEAQWCGQQSIWVMSF